MTIMTIIAIITIMTIIPEKIVKPGNPVPAVRDL
jgi:hypothetical protein